LRYGRQSNNTQQHCVSTATPGLYYPLYNDDDDDDERMNFNVA